MMSDFSIHILGCGSAKPTLKYNPSCQVVRIRGKLLMIDCGEGAQRSFRRQCLNFNRLCRILISHLHGDHCFGLPGLISTLDLLGRTSILHIHGPQGIDDFLQPILDQFCAGLRFPLQIHVHESDLPVCIVDEAYYRVETIPLDHRLPTTGYLISEKGRNARHLVREAADFHKIPLSERSRITEGFDYTSPDGSTIANDLLTRPNDPPRRYAYCSDTAYFPGLAEQIRGVTMLYHEATFPGNRAERAAETKHSTATQAAEIAALANVHRLIIGHYSGSISDPAPLLEEAKAVFPDTVAAEDGLVIDL